MSTIINTFSEVLRDLVKMETKQNEKLKNLNDIIKMCDIDKLMNIEVKEQLKYLMEADTVDKHLIYLKQMVSQYNNQVKTDDNNYNDEYIICQIISKIYFHVELKNPIRYGIIRLIGTLDERRVKIVINTLVDDLKFLINDAVTVDVMNVTNNKIIGCFENFNAGSQSVLVCQTDILVYIHKCLNHCINELRKFDLSPTYKAEIYQCIHCSTRLAVHVLQKFNDSVIKYVNEIKVSVCNVLLITGLPLDTANNSGHLACLCIKHTTNNYEGYIQLLSEYQKNKDEMIIICVCSGLLNVLTTDDLSANDYCLLKMIFDELVNIYNRNSTDCTIILSLSRVFVILSRTFLSMPVAFFSLSYFNSFLITFTWIHLDHYMDSVRHLSCTLISNIVKLASYDNSSSQEQNLLKVLLDKMVATPVWKRAKHAALQALSETLSSVEILSSEPNLVKTLLTSLQQPCVPSYMINSVESLMLQHLKEVDLKIWIEEWVGPLLDTIIKNEGRNHGLEKLLTKAICISPEIVNNIMSQNEKNWVISFSCLHACRKLGLNIGNSVDKLKWRGFVNYSFFTEALCHQNNEVRLSCFSVLVESKKTTECFTKKELEIIRTFFIYNVNDYNSAVRHQKLSLINKLLTRIKDSAQSLKKNNKPKSKKHDHSEEELKSIMLTEYQNFCCWLVSFCINNLFPGASLGRRSTALSILTQCLELSLWPDSANTSINAEILLLCLTDSYENNKIMARRILTSMPAEILNFNEKDSVQQVFETCLKLGTSFRPPDSITGAYLLSTLISFPETALILSNITKQSLDDVYGGVQCIIIALVQQLIKELKVAQINLLAAAATGPLHGQMLLIRHHLEEINLSELCSSLKWRELIGQVVTLCFECSAAVASVVSSDSPEGHLPVDVPQLGVSGVSNDESEKVNVTAQMVLLCSWRTIKEVSLILGHLAKNAPITTDNTLGLLTEDQLINIGDHLSMLLAETKHRGAFEQAYIGFCKLSTRLWSFPGGNLHKLPYKWLQETVGEIASDGKICATRRSAGIPYMIQALVCTEMGVGDGSCFKMCMKQLLQLSSSKDHSIDTHIHALNILRALFRNSELREAVSPFVENAFIVAISGFRSASWGERNSSTLLFSAMMTRVFGVKRTKGYDLSWKNKMTGRIFFQRYPQLYSVLLDQLTSKDTCTSDLRPTLYPVLLLLSRLYPSSLEGTDSNLKLSEFLDPLIDCAGASVMKTRLLTAYAVVPLVLPDKFMEHLDKLFNLIVKSKQENFIHGLILQIIELLKSDQLTNINREEIKIKLNNWIDLLLHFIDRKSNSFIVRCAFIKVLSILISKFYGEQNCFKNDDDYEEFNELHNNFIKLDQIRKNQLKEFILNSEQLINIVHDVLFDININSINDNLNKLLDIISKFPKVIVHILQKKSGLKPFFESKGIDDNHDAYFLLMILCKFPYEKTDIRNALKEDDKQFICETIVNFIYTNRFLLNPSIRLAIANWFNSAFYYFITSTILSPDIRLSLWSYLVILCLDEDVDVQNVLCKTCCQEKILELTLTRFMDEESDHLVQAIGLSAWIFGSIDFSDDCSDAFYELNDKPMDKDELQSDYEEIMLSRHCSTYLKQLILLNPALISSEIPFILTKWITEHCRFANFNESKTILDFYVIIEKEINERSKKISNGYCHFLKYGFKTIKLIRTKLHCFPYKECLTLSWCRYS
ncbi:thyroid adenoma-associated protein homolog [Lycorma delicatula]|uniref:thyroid adenoma-associated protein homolog n=1 Tax=Lycorma delicatula TaxID=130591 RepID=UPI003F5172BD